MKQIIQKPWFLGTLMIVLMLAISFLNLWMLSLVLTSPYDATLWSLATNYASGSLISIYALIFQIIFYVSIVPLLLSVLSILKRTNFGFLVTIIYVVVFESLFIAFQTIYQFLPVFSLTLIGASFGLIILMVFFFALRKRSLMKPTATQTPVQENNPRLKLISLIVLVVDILALGAFLTTFLIPIFNVDIAGVISAPILIDGLFVSDTMLEVMVYFLVNLAFLLGAILFFTNTLTYIRSEKETFIKKSNRLISTIFAFTLLFFFAGLGFDIYLTLLGYTPVTIAYIPMLIMAGLIFVFALLMGMARVSSEAVNKHESVRYPRIESVIYVVLLTAITALILLLPVVRISIVVGDFTDNVSLTGLRILRDYASLDPGYRIVAFILVVMLISSGLSLVIAITSYLAKYRQFDHVVKSATAVNIFFIFVISVSGYYFQIGQLINQAVILNILDFYDVSIPSDYSNYQIAIATDAIYSLIAAAVLLAIMFIRKAFDHDELQLLETPSMPLNNQVENDRSLIKVNEIDDENFNNFDPCPAFTELDQKADYYQQDYDKRKPFKAQGTTLNHLVRFVVDYAKNSRLHLSYTEQDIATFVAGLGASRLSILQGMSGTGKTSLPKIFSEAVFSNCESIEVESSWKDKNELLGYYNEFSMKYTPKKFTLALYKAALNPEIFTIIILDEMNLSRIEYYFSDFLSLMENEEHQREIKLVNVRLSRKEAGNEFDYRALERGHTLKVPPNVWFVGTANRDESTFVISDKVYDRAQTMNFTKRAPKVRNYTNPISQQFYNYQTINTLFTEAKLKGGFDAEKSELVKNVEALLAPFNISFGNRILKQIEDFVNLYKACFANKDVENEAIEKILLSKVVAKLEVKAIDDKDKLVSEFEKLNLYQCVDFIKHLDND